MNKAKKILITGSGGFLGKNLLNALKNDKRFDVIALSSSIHEFSADNVVVLDNDEGLNVSWSDLDVVLNCAFPRTEDACLMPSGLSYINEVLKKAADENVETVVNISSQSVYSQKRKNAADENSQISLESKYAVAKFSTELMTNAVCRKNRHTNIRLASLIGPGFDQRLLNKFVVQALKNEKIKAIDSGQIYGLLDVADAVDGIIKVILDNESFDENYNLGIIDGYSVLELTNAVIELCGGNNDVIVLKGDDYINTTMNCERFYDRFGWNPKVSLQESIIRIIREQNR